MIFQDVLLYESRKRPEGQILQGLASIESKITDFTTERIMADIERYHEQKRNKEPRTVTTTVRGSVA